MRRLILAVTIVVAETLRVVDVRASENPEENAVLIVHDTDK
jgi:ribosomal protein L3